MDKFSGPRSKLSCFGYCVSVKFYYCVALFRLLNIYRYTNSVIIMKEKRWEEKRGRLLYFTISEQNKMVFRAFDFHCYSITISKPFIFHFYTPKTLQAIFTSAIHWPFIANIEFKWYIVEPFLNIQRTSHGLLLSHWNGYSHFRFALDFSYALGIF
jgi:hypothetical protein